MRIRTGHNPEDWTDSIPASPGAFTFRGHLVVGADVGRKVARIAREQRNEAQRETRASRAKAKADVA